jgi:uncharacterized protein (TIGR03083 family)
VCHDVDVDVPTWISAIQQQGERLAEVVASTSAGAPVPSCPEWQLRDLARHQGNVHRWSGRIVAEQHKDGTAEVMAEIRAAATPTDEALADWLRVGCAGLVDALKAAPADLDCFTFVTDGSALEFWARRQAHETAIHRVDAELAAGDRTPIDPDLAADGIDEILTMFLAARGGNLRSEPERTLQVSTAGRHWLVRIGADATQVSRPTEPATADCTVSGDPAEIYLALWNRTPWDGLDVAGDPNLLALWSDKVQIGGRRRP